MTNQERNRDALIEHIAEQDRIIRRRNEQIANQAHNARESQRAIEELDARNNSLAADLAAAVVRADKAERERDEAWADRNDALRREKAEQDRADRAKRERDAAVNSALFAAAPRPLTADDITDEMVERALVVNTDLRPETVRRMLTAALTEPPARPEGAEDIEALVEESLSGDALSDAQVRALADFLAARLADPTRKGA